MSEPTPEEIALDHLYGKELVAPPSGRILGAMAEAERDGTAPRRKVRKPEEDIPEGKEVLVIGEREVVEELYRALGKTLGVPAWQPPPPGDTREQLPDDILAMLAPRMYLSTACEMAEACRRAVLRHPDQAVALMHWADWLHNKRCRLNNKYSGVKCSCECHEEGTPS